MSAEMHILWYVMHLSYVFRYFDVQPDEKDWGLNYPPVIDYSLFITFARSVSNHH
jgi:hypothetical protein